MRRILMGLLMAATAATPLAAQDSGGWRGRNHDGEQREQRSESRQQRQQVQQQPVQQQAERPQAVQQQRFEGRGGWGGRRDAQQQQAVQVQQQEQVRGERQSRSGWGGQRDFQQQQVQQQAVQAQQQEQVRGERQGRGGWGGRRDFQQQQVQQQAVQAQQQEQVRAERYQGRSGGNWAGNRQQDNGYRNSYQGSEAARSYGQRGNYSNNRGNYGNYGNRGYNNGSWGNRSGGSSWNRSWRNDNRYDWQRYRYQNRRLFSPGRYYAPYGGYGYNPLSIGIVLGEAFFGRDYWIDPIYYHLPPAPPGTEWVRYYNDVVLVDIYTGEVVDVINDFFW